MEYWHFLFLFILFSSDPNFSYFDDGLFRFLEESLGCLWFQLKGYFRSLFSPFGQYQIMLLHLWELLLPAWPRLLLLSVVLKIDPANYLDSIDSTNLLICRHEGMYPEMSRLISCGKKWEAKIVSYGTM